MPQDTSNDVKQPGDRGRYLTLSEFSAKYPQYAKRTLINFIDHGMPKDERGGLFFIYERETLEWIERNVEPKMTYFVKGA